MAKPKLTPEQSAEIIKAKQADIAEKITYIDAGDAENKSKKVPVKAFQIGLSSDLLGSKMSFSASRTLDLEATPLGIVMRSKNSKRKILVGWANIKATEFYWDEE